MEGIMRAQMQVRDAPVIEAELERWNARPLLLEMENHSQKVAYCADGHKPGREYPSNMGTLHMGLMMGLYNLFQPDKMPKIVQVLGFTCQGQCCLPEGGTQGKVQALTVEEKTQRDRLCDAYFEDVNFTRYIDIKRSSGIRTVKSLNREELCSCQLYAYADRLRSDGIEEHGNLPEEGMDLNFWGRLLVELFPLCDLRWVGVGEVRNANHDKLQSTANQLADCLEYLDAFESVNSHSARRLSGRAPLLTAVGIRAVSTGTADWRSLGLRVALYDDLRECRITNPSGVSWSFPKRQSISRGLVFSNQLGDRWDYYATVISIFGLEKALRNNDGLTVVTRPAVGNNAAVTENWDLKSRDVLLIFPNANGIPIYCGLELWLLSHLSYPLVNVLEGFQMGQFQENGTVGYFNTFTFRNSGLVDLKKAYRKIVFCTTSNVKGTLNIGRTTLREPEDGDDPICIDFNTPLKKIITKCLESRYSLKRDFTDYCSNYFTGGLNWIEIEQMVAYLTTRWHIQPECTVEEGARVLHWLPKGHGEFYADGVPQQDIYGVGDFGQQSACLGFDHATVPQQYAQSHPVLSIGTWTVEAEIAVCLGVGKYVTMCTESATLIEKRLNAGGWDRLIRASYQRLGFEEWKRAAGICDEILDPSNETYEGIQSMWGTITESGLDGMCAASIANMLCTQKVRWHWEVNKRFKTCISYTGIRGCVDWVKNHYSTTWESANMEVGTNSEYALETNTAHWANMFWIQVREGKRTEFLDQILMRLDVNVWYNAIKYKSWPSGTEAKGFYYRVETRNTAKLTDELNWISFPDEQINGTGWGWGLRSYIKLWNNGGYATIAIRRDVAQACCGTDFAAGTWLARGPKAPVLYQPNPLYKPMGWNLTSEDCYRFRTAKNMI